MRPYNPAQDVHPFARSRSPTPVTSAVNPFDIEEAIATIDAAARRAARTAPTLLTLGGDHTIALPILRSLPAHHGPVAVLHFDAHLDTWDTYFGAPFTHGTPFRRASRGGSARPERCLHIGIRGPLYAATDLEDDAALGFQIVRSDDYELDGVAGAVDRMRRRLGDGPVYVSVDIDVLDPAHAPGTGTPEAGGLTSRELLNTLRGLVGLNVVGADIVEVAPAYDHAEITGIAAAHVAYELLSVLAARSVIRNGGAAVVETLARTASTPSSASRARTTWSCTGTCRRPASGRVTTRHEQGAGYAADGYARSAGAPAWSSPRRGPGAAQRGRRGRHRRTPSPARCCSSRRGCRAARSAATWASCTRRRTPAARWTGSSPGAAGSTSPEEAADAVAEAFAAFRGSRPADPARCTSRSRSTCWRTRSGRADGRGRAAPTAPADRSGAAADVLADAARR